MQKVDLVVRGGLIVDGSGSEPFVADLAINRGRIAGVGDPGLEGRQEIDAEGRLVTPGFIDLHTHYDGHVTWEDRLRQSSAHGVSTVVMGNCGVGFAPCAPGNREALVEVMEGVEDIPNPVLSAGLPWSWRSFPEYLDVLGQRRFDVDVAALAPHTPIRVEVMGARALEEHASAKDRARIARITVEALRAGAFGFSTSRLRTHRSSRGDVIPSFHAAAEELIEVARAMRGLGSGVIQMTTDFDEDLGVFDLMRDLARESAKLVTYTLVQLHSAPRQWRELLDRTETAVANGESVRAQVFPRGVGFLLGHDATLNPFIECPSYRALAGLPFERKIAALCDPVLRRKILSENADALHPNPMSRLVRDFGRMFVLESVPNYEPSPADSIAALAESAGVDPEAYAYDVMLRDDGRRMLYLVVANYADGDLDPCFTMMNSPATMLGLGDAGAHSGIIADASYPTFLLSHWTRDRKGPRISLPQAVNALTRRPAEAIGMTDRGLLRTGLKADVNVIDYQHLTLSQPVVTHDLPANGRRIVQRAEGYDANIVNGQVVYRHGRAAGPLPGRLVRRNTLMDGMTPKHAAE